MFLTECKQAVLYTVEDIFLCDAAVSHISEDSATLIVTKSNADLSLTEAHVTFFDSSKGLVTYSCELSEFKKSKRATNTEYYFTRCTVHEQISVMQRRNDIKVPVNISVTLSAKTREGTLSNIEAKIWNISAGGIFLQAASHFHPAISLPSIFLIRIYPLSLFKWKSSVCRHTANCAKSSVQKQKTQNLQDTAVSLYIFLPAPNRRSAIMYSARISSTADGFLLSINTTVCFFCPVMGQEILLRLLIHLLFLQFPDLFLSLQFPFFLLSFPEHNSRNRYIYQ